MTMAPRPIFTSEALWYWANRPPDSPTRALDRISATILVPLVLIPWARAILGLLPVARTALPSSVPKNQHSTATMPTQNSRAMRQVCSG